MSRHAVIARTPGGEQSFTVSEHSDELEARIAALQAEVELRDLVKTPYVVTVEIVKESTLT